MALLTRRGGELPRSLQCVLGIFLASRKYFQKKNLNLMMAGPSHGPWSLLSLSYRSQV